jgi:hypoxanthine-guanine phosphoribosyltransferase
MKELQVALGGETPQNIKLATIYFKPDQNQTEITPDYYITETDEWIVFPHELDGLTKEEVYANKPPVLKELLGE